MFLRPRICSRSCATGASSKWNPMLNAFRHVDIGIAHAKQAQMPAMHSRNTASDHLDGIPIAVKDNIDIEGLITRSGLGARGTNRPAQTRTRLIIRRLRSIGRRSSSATPTCMKEHSARQTTIRIVVGRTIPGAQELYARRFVRRFGCSRRGRVSARSRLGTDTMGSIRLPAAYCGIAGYKPGHRHRRQFRHRTTLQESSIRSVRNGTIGGRPVLAGTPS